MTERFRPPSPEQVAHVRALAERQLSAAELDAYVRAPWGDGELEAAAELITWFMRRYPTPLDRLRAARRAYRRARMRMPR
jgi:hypothetical protein